MKGEKSTQVSSQSIDGRSLFKWQSIDHKELSAADHNKVQTYTAIGKMQSSSKLPITTNSKSFNELSTTEIDDFVAS